MSHKHGHDKQHNHGHGHGRTATRDRKQPIGMVKQRSLLATVLAFGLVAFVIVSILTVIAYMIWG